MKYDSQIDLKQRYQELKDIQPAIRARNAAEKIGVSEVELLAAHIGKDVIRLIDEAQNILKEVEKLGEVMALTRNEYCVHERKGVYQNANFFEHGAMKQGLFVNSDIDLRLFMNHWKYNFAVTEQSKSGERKSLQFFDKAGVAIHKIYLTSKSEESAFDELINTFKYTEQSNSITIENYEPKAQDKPDNEIDWNGFRNAWANLKDTHDFFSMLRKFNVGREQGLRGIGNEFAYEVNNNAARKILEQARDKKCEIMVFVGNRGCIQIHTGNVAKLVEHGNWYNVLDPMFNLHLDESQVVRTWVTKKPTEDGIVTALEIFDKHSELIATFFGKRKPGIPELGLWREIIDLIPTKDMDNVA